MTIVRSSIPERDLGGVGLGCCAAGAAVVLVLVLLCMSLHRGGRSSRAAVVPLVQTRSTRTTVQGEALVLGVLTCAVKLQLGNKFTQGELNVAVVPEQPRACLLSHPTQSGAGSCSACSALLVGVDFKLNDAYASARGGLGARARHAQRFSLADNIGRGRLGFVVVVVLQPSAHLLTHRWLSHNGGGSAASHARY